MENGGKNEMWETLLKFYIKRMKRRKNISKEYGVKGSVLGGLGECKKEK